jgi:hypothetical protein
MNVYNTDEILRMPMECFNTRKTVLNTKKNVFTMRNTQIISIKEVKE